MTVAETAILASAVAAWAVAQSVWTTLKAGRWNREERVWQQRKEVYIDLLKWAIRQRELAKIPSLHAWLKVHGNELPGPEETIALEARASAFSSKEVVDKVNAREDIWKRLAVAIGDLESLEVPGVDTQAMRKMFTQSIGQPEDRVEKLSKQLTNWVDELIDLVSAELQSSRSPRRKK